MIWTKWHRRGILGGLGGEWKLAKEEPLMDASIRFTTQRIGALPVIIDFFERLQLSAIINEVVPWEGGQGDRTLTYVPTRTCSR